MALRWGGHKAAIGSLLVEQRQTTKPDRGKKTRKRERKLLTLFEQQSRDRSAVDSWDR